MINPLSAKRLLTTVIGVSVFASAQAAVNSPTTPITIDLGVAAPYAGFFFGDVTGVDSKGKVSSTSRAAADVEGRLAVGGNLTGQGFDVGYRTLYNTPGPALVVKGNLDMSNSGTIYNGPTSPTVNTNVGAGPGVGGAVGPFAIGSITYGTISNVSSGQYTTATQNSNYIDFAAAKTYLTNLSNQLTFYGTYPTSVAANVGSVSGTTLTGNGTTNLQVFNLGNTEIKNISLSNIKAGAFIIINSTLTDVKISGGMGNPNADIFNITNDPLFNYRDRILYNFPNATKVDFGTSMTGSVLAPLATVTGTGHVEGQIIANSLIGNDRKIEIGYEPFRNGTVMAAVPEADTYAMLLAGLGLIGFVARRRQQA